MPLTGEEHAGMKGKPQLIGTSLKPTGLPGQGWEALPCVRQMDCCALSIGERGLCGRKHCETSLSVTLAKLVEGVCAVLLRVPLLPGFHLQVGASEEMLFFQGECGSLHLNNFDSSVSPKLGHFSFYQICS